MRMENLDLWQIELLPWLCIPGRLAGGEHLGEGVEDHRAYPETAGPCYGRLLPPVREVAPLRRAGCAIRAANARGANRRHSANFGGSSAGDLGASDPWRELEWPRDAKSGPSADSHRPVRICAPSDLHRAVAGDCGNGIVHR